MGESDTRGQRPNSDSVRSGHSTAAIGCSHRPLARAGTLPPGRSESRRCIVIVKSALTARIPSWRVHVLWSELYRSLSARCGVCGPNLKGCEARGPSGSITDDVSVGHQAKDGKRVRYRNPADTDRARRRGDRIVVMFAAARMSLPGKWPLGRDVRDHGETPRVSRPPAQHRHGTKFDQSLGFS